MKRKQMEKKKRRRRKYKRKIMNLPREKTPSELAEEARTEPNEEEIKN